MKYTNDNIGECPSCEAPVQLEFSFTRGTTLRQVVQWEEQGQDVLLQHALTAVRSCTGCGLREVVKG